MSVRLKEQVPAFRIDDDAFERLWRSVEAKWAGEEPARNTLTVRETVRVAGRRTPEEHEQDYQSVDELRRATGGPGVLRAYTLYISSWGKESRAVRFGAYGGGSTATVEVNAADAAWCREVVDTVLELLRPHTLWYAAVHRISLSAMTAAAVLALVSVPLAYSRGFPLGSVLAFALYLALMAVVLFPERIFPAADILVRRRGTQPAVPGDASRKTPDRGGGEPARQDRGDVVDLSGHRERKRSEGGDTTSS